MTMADPGAAAPALRALVGGALTVPIRDLAPRYTARSGIAVEIFLGTTPLLIAEATSGRGFDLGLVPVDVMGDAAARARFAPGPTTDIVRAGFGVAVRAGAARPAIDTADALRAALLAAGSIATIPESAGGRHILAVFERLGIAAEMRARLRPQPNPGAIPGAVIAGEAELAIFLLNVLAVPGVELVGPFPPPLQRDLVFTAALAAAGPNAAAAGDFLAYLRSADAAAVFRARGLTPVA